MTTTELDDIATIKAVSALIDLNPDASATTKAETAIRTYLAAIGAGGQAVAHQWRERDRVMKHEENWSYVDYNTGLKIAEHPEKYEVLPLYTHPAPSGQAVAREDVAYFTHDKWGGYWQTVRDGKPYNFRLQPHPADERVVEALKQAAGRFEEIRLILVHHLHEPERSAFWKAVDGRTKCQAALAQEGRNG